jgi:hypothetical protein
MGYGVFFRDTEYPEKTHQHHVIKLQQGVGLFFFRATLEKNNPTPCVFLNCKRVQI